LKGPWPRKLDMLREFVDKMVQQTLEVDVALDAELPLFFAFQAN